MQSRRAARAAARQAGLDRQEVEDGTALGARRGGGRGARPGGLARDKKGATGEDNTDNKELPSHGGGGRGRGRGVGRSPGMPREWGMGAPGGPGRGWCKRGPGGSGAARGGGWGIRGRRHHFASPMAEQDRQLIMMRRMMLRMRLQEAAAGEFGDAVITLPVPWPTRT